MTVTTHPYSNLPRSAFWQTAVATVSPFEPEQLYRPKWPIEKGMKIATGGSCFAQHITRLLRTLDFGILDTEPPTVGLPEAEAQRYGYRLFSARYGNIYTVHQLLGITREAFTGLRPVEGVWALGNRFIDAMRPAVEPEGVGSPEEVQLHRAYHLAKVRQLFLSMDLFVFTLGLTEAWTHADDATTYPLCPGTQGGVFDGRRYIFRNYTFNEILEAFCEFRSILMHYRGGRPLRFLLTVSPVPLTATASGDHVLAATTYSKSVLRAVAGELAQSDEAIDYFPSYEIITNQAARAIFYDHNLRSVRQAGVHTVMKTFLEAHAIVPSPSVTEPTARPEPPAGLTDAEESVRCEEVLLGAFGER